MAYYSQEMKAKAAPKIRKLLKAYGLKGTLSVNHLSTVTLTIRSGKLDFIGNYKDTMKARCPNTPVTVSSGSLDVNPYWYEDHFQGRVLAFIKAAFAILNDGNWDKSDIQSDYFNVGWYSAIHIGDWRKPYVLETLARPMYQGKVTDDPTASCDIKAAYRRG